MAAMAAVSSSVSSSKAPVLPSPARFQTTFAKTSFGEEARQVVLNVYYKLRCESPIESYKAIVRRTSELTRVGYSTIFRWKKLVQSIPDGTPSVPSPKRKRKRSAPPTPSLLDSFDLGTLRLIVHGFFRRSECPTLSKVLGVAWDNDKFHKISRTKLWRALVDLGFTFVKRNRDSLLMERTYLVFWRATYLRAIRMHHLVHKTVYYQDETWVNAGHTRSKVLKDTTVKTPRDAFNKGLTVGLKNPSGKGERFIVVHAGSNEGFVDDAAEVFRAKKGNGDYHEEMNGARFEKWFTEKLLQNLRPNSVIVMDNASYHSVKGSIAGANKSFKLAEVGVLTPDTVIDSVVIHLGSDDDKSSDEDMDDSSDEDMACESLSW
ncbi:uncharacterized protein ISCGN_031369 [Ixodes scapularis]